MKTSSIKSPFFPTVASTALVLAFAMAMPSLGFAKNYTLTIGDQVFEIDEDKPEKLKLKNGETLTVKLEKKDFVTYDKGVFSFEHANGLSPASTDLGEGIEQTMMTSPLGTAIIIQQYSGLNPSDMVDVMINELTKEEVNYGYKLKATDAQKVLSDGTTLVGKKVITSHQDSTYTRHILVAGKGDSGILIITQLEKENEANESPIIDMFWETLKIKL